MRVLVIPEDFLNDQYVLKPIIEAMMESCGKPRAHVDICRTHRLRSVDRALSWPGIAEILDHHRGMYDLFLLCVDRDGEVTRRAALDRIEQEALAFLPSDKRLFAVEAWQELEVWVLAGQDLLEGWTWSEIRQDRDPKETYFNVLVESRGLLDELGGGRKPLALEAARRYGRVRQRCPEDVAALEERIRQWLGERQ